MAIGVTTSGKPSFNHPVVLFYVKIHDFFYVVHINLIETMGSNSPLNDTIAGERPNFHDLPLRKGDPKASAWGLWGDDDELGTLNLLTTSIIKYAAAEVMTGETISLK